MVSQGFTKGNKRPGILNTAGFVVGPKIYEEVISNPSQLIGVGENASSPSVIGTGLLFGLSRGWQPAASLQKAAKLYGPNRTRENETVKSKNSRRKNQSVAMPPSLAPPSL